MRSSRTLSQFYRPINTEASAKVPRKFGYKYTDFMIWKYRPIKPLGIPKPLKETNPYFGPERLPNYIPSAAEVWRKKAEDWGYPNRTPPPRGLRESPEYFPYFFEKYFPETDCRLVLDTVINTDTREPCFPIPTAHEQRGNPKLFAKYLLH
jgi:large subunit ribosomal protein L23